MNPERGRRRLSDEDSRSRQEMRAKAIRRSRDEHVPRDRDRSQARSRGPSTSRAAEPPSTSRAAEAASTSRAAQAASTQRTASAGRYLENYEIVNSRPADLTSKMGKEGTPIKLLSNYFKIETKREWRIVHYHVTFTPEIEIQRIRCGILSEHAKVLGTGYIFDGAQLFTTKKFVNEATELTGKSKQGVDYTIKIKYVGYISSLESRFLQVLNLILRRSMKGLQLEQVGRNLFDPHARVVMREFQLELWPGYETAIRQHEKDILMCTEITHKVMRTETVYDILRRVTKNPSRYQDEARHSIIGLIVLTDYNNNTYRVNDIDFAQTPRTTFNCKGQDISFLDYYLKRYNIRIKDPNQPLLVSKNKTKSYNTKGTNDDTVVIIPELCRVTGLTDQMRSNFRLMSAMSDHTRMNPVRRIDRLRTFNSRLRTTPESVKVFSDWHLKLDQNLVEVPGRVIGGQKIIFSNRRLTSGNDWTRDIKGQQMLTTPRDGLDRWAVIAPRRNLRDLQNLLRNLNQTASGMGFVIRPPREYLIADDHTSSYVQALDECARIDPKLILCLVTNNNVERYSAIKKRGCVDRGVATQVVTTRANQKGLSVATKIAIQINCKLGYTPWMVAIPLSGLMTIGFDIAKSTRDRSKAFGALVASMDLQKNSTYFSTVTECNSYDVIGNHIWPMVSKALRQYVREHEKLPNRILFYRDGVSSGSLKQLYEYEVKEITEKLEVEYKRAGAIGTPMFAYVVVSKTSNTRFFTTNNENPPPGTVVDDVVTHPEWYDFYLVSQSIRQGTVAPTHYNVFKPTIRLTPDQMQKLTYMMCHLYYNWSGTTRVPAVCQYAKKLATLVATNLHSIPQNVLEKKFYYL